MDDIIVVLILCVIVFSASFYIYKAKKNGKKCIGCPYADSCAKSDGCSCSSGNSPANNKK